MKTIQDFYTAKQAGKKISLVTCYDATFAALIAPTDIDAILVGDSVAMVVYGHDTTIPADLKMMTDHVSAVRRGAPDKFIIGDMPFLAHRKGTTAAVEAAGELLKAGANAVKLEGAQGHIDTVRYIVESGIPVMGHLGLTPQLVHQLGGFKVQARNVDAAEALIEDAKALEKAGCFSMVLECVPRDVAKRVTEAVRIPTIGIGAGQSTDGQVLVLQDLLGLNTRFQPRFVRKFTEGAETVTDALSLYVNEVQSGGFPAEKESFK